MKKFRSGSVIFVFGLPCSGKTTIVKALVASSKEMIATVSSGDIARKLSTEAEINHMAAGNLFPDETKIREELLSTIRKRQAAGSELVIVEGFPRSLDQVRWCFAEQLLGAPADGCVIQIIGDKLLERAGLRMRDNQDEARALQLKVATQQKEIGPMEDYLMRFGGIYFTVVNYQLDVAVINMAKILGLRK